ncbi:MAG: phosphotransferase [Nitrososphaeraceae archaeon]
MNFEINNIDLTDEEKHIDGLKIILDKQLLSTYMRSYLETITPDNLQMTYIRYKPGMNWLVNYIFENKEHKINIYTKAYGYDKDIKIQKSVRRKTAVSYDIPGRLHFKNEGVAICVFPNDNKLKYLRYLENKESQRVLLRNVFPDKSNLWDSCIKFLRYKPERRFVGILSKNSVNLAILRFYTKYDYYKSLKIANLFKSSNLNIPRQIGNSDDFYVLSVDWIEGKPLSDILMNDNVYSASKNIYDVGLELSKLHSSYDLLSNDHPHQNELSSFPDYSSNDDQNILLSLANQMKLICPNNIESILSISNFLKRKFSEISLLSSKIKKTAIIHGDFYAKQVIIDNNQNKTSFIDLDEVCIGDPLVDVGNFIAHLYYMVISKRLTKDKLPLYIHEFICGYKNGIKKYTFDNLTLYVITGLYLLLPHSFRHCEIDWIKRTDEIIILMEKMIHNYDRCHFEEKNSFP